MRQVIRLSIGRRICVRRRTLEPATLMREVAHAFRSRLNSGEYDNMKQEVDRAWHALHCRSQSKPAVRDTDPAAPSDEDTPTRHCRLKSRHHCQALPVERPFADLSGVGLQAQARRQPNRGRGLCDAEVPSTECRGEDGRDVCVHAIGRSDYSGRGAGGLRRPGDRHGLSWRWGRFMYRDTLYL